MPPKSTEEIKAYNRANYHLNKDKINANTIKESQDVKNVVETEYANTKEIYIVVKNVGVFHSAANTIKENHAVKTAEVVKYAIITERNHLVKSLEAVKYANTISENYLVKNVWVAQYANIKK